MEIFNIGANVPERETSRYMIWRRGAYDKCHITEEPYDGKLSRTVVRPGKAGMYSERKELAETRVGVS
jgi:hypothetical protein